MTTIKSKVTREGPICHAKGRPIIVSIEPGGLLGFRLKGTRKIYRLSIESAFWLAAKAEAGR